MCARVRGGGGVEDNVLVWVLLRVSLLRIL
jgi:hypothetical protein